jgi:hypothetical protein
MSIEEVVTATTKKAVRDLLKKLPDNCSLEDVQYHPYVLQKAERGLKDAEKGQAQTAQSSRVRRQAQSAMSNNKVVYLRKHRTWISSS